MVLRGYIGCKFWGCAYIGNPWKFAVKFKTTLNVNHTDDISLNAAVNTETDKIWWWQLGTFIMQFKAVMRNSSVNEHARSLEEMLNDCAKLELNRKKLDVDVCIGLITVFYALELGIHCVTQAWYMLWYCVCPSVYLSVCHPSLPCQKWLNILLSSNLCDRHAFRFFLVQILPEPEFENTYVTFFSDFKNMTFYVFLKWRIKKS